MIDTMLRAGREPRTGNAVKHAIVSLVMLGTAAFAVTTTIRHDREREYAAVAARGIPLSPGWIILVGRGDPVRITATERTNQSDGDARQTISVIVPRSDFASDVAGDRPMPWIEADDPATLLPLAGPVEGATPVKAARVKLHLTSPGDARMSGD